MTRIPLPVPSLSDSALGTSIAGSSDTSYHHAQTQTTPLVSPISVQRLVEQLSSVLPAQDIYVPAGEDILGNMTLRNQRTGETVTVDRTFDVFDEFDLTSGRA